MDLQQTKRYWISNNNLKQILVLKKSLGPHRLCVTLKNYHQMVHKLFYEIEKERILSNLFYEVLPITKSNKEKKENYRPILLMNRYKSSHYSIYYSNSDYIIINYDQAGSPSRQASCSPIWKAYVIAADTCSNLKTSSRVKLSRTGKCPICGWTRLTFHFDCF